MENITLTVKVAPDEPRNPVSIYHLAQGFYLAGNRCLLNIDVAPGTMQCLTSPGVVNLCFSIELFLKALIVSAGGTPKRTHKLVELFSAAPAATQEAMRSQFNAKINPTLDELLVQISDYFVQVRYGYEFNIFCFHEYPVYNFAQMLYMHTAQQLGVVPAIQTIRV
jgi:hypothetical protein